MTYTEQPPQTTSISVKGLPEINIHRDWIDYASTGASVSLLIVGVFGVLYAKRTLNAIQRQLVELKRAGIQAHKMISAASQQASAARDSADEARDTARLTQCADVMIDGIDLESAQPSFGHLTRVIIHVKNFGPTRASNVRLDFRLSMGTLGEFIVPLSPIVLAKDASAPIMFKTFRELLITDHLALLESGQIAFGFKGTISYDDVFGRSHSVECFGDYNRFTRNFNATQRPVKV